MSPFKDSHCNDQS